MGLVQLGFYISDSAQFSTARFTSAQKWSITLMTLYEIKTSWGSSLGGHYFTGEDDDIEVAAAKASLKVEEYIEAELARPKPKVMSRLDHEDLSGLVSSVTKALKRR